MEPHAYPEWDTDQESLINEFLIAITEVKNMLSPHGICLAFDIPVWFDGIDIAPNSTLAKQIQSIGDKVVLMDYYTTYDRITDFAVNELNFAMENNKTVEVGIETGCCSGAGCHATNTFCGHPNWEMEDIMKRTSDFFVNNWGNTFTGMAIHHLETLISRNQYGELVDRAVWCWQNGVLFYPSDERHDLFMNFMYTHRINTIYAACRNQILNYHDVVASFLNETCDLGIKVDLLLGDNQNSRWIYNKNDLYDIVNASITFYQNSIEIPNYKCVNNYVPPNHTVVIVLVVVFGSICFIFFVFLTIALIVVGILFSKSKTI